MPPVVVGVAVAAASVFVPTFIAGALGATLALGLANLGVGLILSGIAAELMPKPQLPVLPSQARTVSVRQPVMPRETVYGYVRKGGTIVFMDQTNDSKILHLVIVLAGHEVENIGAIYFNGEMAADASGNPVGRWDGDPLDYVFVAKRTGSTTQSAFSTLTDVLPDKWTEDHRLRGCAAIYLRLRWSVDIYPNGLPAITADVWGKNDILDPRTGTRGYTNNAALCIADYMSDTKQTLRASIGVEGGINEDLLIASANICDESVARNGGGTEKRYTINGVIPDNYSPEQVLPQMALAMAGSVIWRGNDFDIMAGAYRSPSLTITDSDIVEGGLTLATKVSRSENFNGVRGQFVSPENDWQPDDFPAYQSSTYVAEDGEEVWLDVALPFTTSSGTAQRIAKILLEKNRRQQAVRLNGKLSTWRAVTGQTVQLTYDRWGFASKPFEVTGIELGLDNGKLRPTIALRETSPLVYSWTASEEKIYAVAPTTNLPSPFDVSPPGQPVLTQELYATRDGSSVRALIRAKWSASPSTFVQLYRLQARRTNDLDGTETGAEFRDFARTQDLEWEIRDIEPGRWEVRVATISTLGVQSAWSTQAINALGTADAPVTLDGVTLQTAGGLAILKWALPTSLDVRIGGRIVIRHSTAVSPSWANSTSLDEVNGNETIAVVPLKPGAYLLRPQDAAGRLGPVTIVSTKAAQAVGFANLTTLTAHTAFSGTKTDVEVVTSTLRLVMPATNRTPAPDDLSDAGYTPVRASVSTDVATPPGGSATADKLVEDSTAASDHYISFASNVVAGRAYEMSVVLKADGRSRVQMRFSTNGFADGAALNINLATPSATNVGAIEAFTLSSLGDGWYRVWAKATCDTTFTGNPFLLYLQDATGALTYNGDGTSGVLVADWQLVEKFPTDGPFIGSYEFATTMDLTTVKRSRVRSDVLMSALNLASDIDDRTDFIDDWADFDDTDGAYVDVVVEGRFTDDDPAGSPTWTDWKRVDATEEEFRGAQFRALLSTQSPDFNVIVEELTVTADEVA